MRGLDAIFLKVCVFVCAVLALTGLPYRLLGLWYRTRGTRPRLFYCYAGSPAFANSYALPGIANFFRWRPSPIGIMRQGGTSGLVLASPLTEAEMPDPANAADFVALQRRLARIQRWTGATDIALAGIMPGLVARDGILRVADTRAVVVQAVAAAIAAIAPSDAQPIILLGGAGRIGSALARDLRQKGRDVRIVDPRGAARTLPADLSGRPALLVDVSRRGAIAGYIPLMWPGLTVLNEVFPAPSRRHVRAMINRGVAVHHLAGVAGRIIPPLPHGYGGAVPCCAATLVDGARPEVRLVALGSPAVQSSLTGAPPAKLLTS